MLEQHEALDGFEAETLEAGPGLNPEGTGADRVVPGNAQVADPSEDVGWRREPALVVEHEMGHVGLECPRSYTSNDTAGAKDQRTTGHGVHRWLHGVKR